MATTRRGRGSCQGSGSERSWPESLSLRLLETRQALPPPRAARVTADEDDEAGVWKAQHVGSPYKRGAAFLYFEVQVELGEGAGSRVLPTLPSGLVRMGAGPGWRCEDRFLRPGAAPRASRAVPFTPRSRPCIKAVFSPNGQNPNSREVCTHSSGL